MPRRLPRLRREAVQYFIYEMEVAAASRRKGVGTALMKWLIDHAHARGDDLFVLTTASNEAAVAFYKRLGGRPRNGGDDRLYHFPAHRPS